MATTRIKAGNSTQVYHRHAASNDAPLADVATNEALAIGLGSSADFQLDSDDNQTYTDESSVASASGETQMEALASPILVWIKHSGFQEAAKTTASTSTVTVQIGIGGAAANGFISLFRSPLPDCVRFESLREFVYRDADLPHSVKPKEIQCVYKVFWLTLAGFRAPLPGGSTVIGWCSRHQGKPKGDQWFSNVPCWGSMIPVLARVR